MDALPAPAPAAAPPTPAKPDPRQIAAAAAAAVCDDPAIAELLRRKAGGEKLTSQEHGRIGAWKSRQIAATARSGVPAAPLALRESGNGAGAPAGTPEADPALAEAEADLVVLPPADADLVRGTVKAVLGKVNAIGQRHLLAAARAAGADAASLDRFSRAEVVSADDQAVLSDTAPLVAASLGVNPRHVPVAAFFGTLAACGLNFYQAIAELKEIQAKQTKPAATTQQK